MGVIVKSFKSKIYLSKRFFERNKLQTTLNIIIQHVKDDIQNYFSTGMFRGTLCIYLLF